VLELILFYDLRPAIIWVYVVFTIDQNANIVRNDRMVDQVYCEVVHKDSESRESDAYQPRASSATTS